MPRCGWFHGEYHPDAADGPCVLPESRGQPGVSADRNLVHQHDRTGPADSHGRNPGRLRIRFVGFWIWLDILSNQLDDVPLLPRPDNLPTLGNATGGSVECIGLRHVVVSPGEW